VEGVTGNRDSYSDGLAQVPHAVLLELPEGTLRETWQPSASEVVFWVRDEVGTVQLAWKHAPEPAQPGMRLWLELRGGGNRREIPLDAAARGEWSIQLFAGEYELALEVQEARPLTGTKQVWRQPLMVGAGTTVQVEFP
jgi:hypothetical protein